MNSRYGLRVKYLRDSVLVRQRHTAVTSAQSGAGGQPFHQCGEKKKMNYGGTHISGSLYGVTVVKGCFYF